MTCDFFSINIHKSNNIRILDKKVPWITIFCVYLQKRHFFRLRNNFVSFNALA